ncbi:MAG: isoprenylcysteine carboxylmethyltransferase family protein [Firmicutes bacterium]|nr:isoprenylcysteine carboxylmethyltransferase family protein [Bacillota bacterium]
MSKKSITLRSRGFVDPRKGEGKAARYRLGIILPIPIILLITLWSKPTATSLWRGGICLALGELIRWWSAGYIGGWQTSLEEERLVTSGPYALVRNPCYVGSFLAGLGLAVMSGRWLAYVVLLGFTVLGMTRLVPGEEALLGEQFGLAYEAYYQVVPRYLPGWRQFGKWLRARRQGTEPDQRFGSRDAWLAERYMLIFLVGVILAMVVRWRF